MTGTALLVAFWCAAQNAAAPVVQPHGVTAVLEAFRHTPVVGLEEVHGDEAAHAFRLRVIRDARFASTVTDIVVEFGNARYQAVIDRYVSGGVVAMPDLRRVWQDTTQAHAIWDRPIYAEFFKAVREVNAAAPDRHLRVLLGDPPIDWNLVRTPDDRRKWLQLGRSTYPVEVIRRDVLDKGRRALVLYGAYHLIRDNLSGPNLSERLTAATGVRPFVVLTHPTGNLEAVGVDPAGVPTHSVTVTRGTPLERQMDGILYLGPASERRMSRLHASLCADAAYRRMRTGRMLLAGFTGAEAALGRECQAQPDFSGAWKPIETGQQPPRPAPAKPGGPPPPPRTLFATIALTAAEMKLERRVETGGREVTYAFVYKMDGTESVNQMGPLTFRTTASWNDGRLTLASAISINGKPVGELTEVYKFEGQDLVVESHRKVPAGTFTNKDVFQRVPAAK